MPLDYDNDFPLFPYGWTQDQTYLPSSTFDDHNYMCPTAPESFAAQHTYAHSAYDQSAFIPESYRPIKDQLQAPGSSYSPSNSTSRSFDFQNPHMLSSTSDSGASGQSATSSGMNSPSIQPRQSESWAQQADMDMVPSVVHHDSLVQDIFATTGLDFGPILVTDKGCVDELLNFSFSQQPQNSSPFLPSLSTYICPQTAPSIGIYSHWTTNPMISALDFGPTRATPAPHLHISSSVEAASPNNSVFRSPTTPASAAATSPVLERLKGRRTASATPPAPRRARGSLLLSTFISVDGIEVPPPPQAPRPHLQSPFFYHSNPSLIQPTQYTGAQFPDIAAVQSPLNLHAFPQAPSPIPVKNAIHSPRMSVGKAPSPNARAQNWQPYPAFPGSRRQSISSIHSRRSHGSISSDDSNKGLCPNGTCGRHVKDLKAHMLTHQNERPEKCPIPTCDYHTKGFARKYDKSRHTLTHYKGTMVCGFCPGSGSAAEKSFNRADVFKRHLTSVHGVEQTPPDARRKSPSVAAGKRPLGVLETSGMCSTCGITFLSAQDFYEHLDDCVLRVVQQAEPSKAINEKLLSSVSEDQQVHETMERHQLPNTIDLNASTSFDQDKDAEEKDDDDEDDSNDALRHPLRALRQGRHQDPQVGWHRFELTTSTFPNTSGVAHLTINGAVSKPGQPKGLTRSKNGVPLMGAATNKGAKRRKNYPLSWGAAPEKMKQKKRVLCVYEGQRRLWKDDMMLDADNEVRIPLAGNGADGRAWVTDLDVLTLRRAEGVLSATDEEKGPWVRNDAELERLMQ
ncbi:hypothetical protein LTR87_013481 [Friedmanniomyces endolithicus]|nr:hypothetical protein LTR87_013481 [Friedmanniomyces endolithicus]